MNAVLLRRNANTRVMHYRIIADALCIGLRWRSDGGGCGDGGWLTNSLSVSGADERALSPVNVWRRHVRSPPARARISETNETETDCIIAQLSPVYGHRRRPRPSRVIDRR